MNNKKKTHTQEKKDKKNWLTARRPQKSCKLTLEPEDVRLIPIRKTFVTWARKLRNRRRWMWKTTLKTVEE